MTDLQPIIPADLGMDDPQILCDNLVVKYTWAQDMANCVQNEEWHSEGDVMTHTRMVLEQMFSSPEFKDLSSQNKEIMKAAVLLHDVAKPPCTVEDEGYLSSKGHAVLGAKMARLILSDALGPEHRETVVSLVRNHMFPIFFMEREDPEYSIISMSFKSDNKLLAILAEADTKGRMAKTESDSSDRVSLFRDVCGELGCLGAPFSFDNDHGRVVYFANPGKYDPRYCAYDSTSFEVTMMCGLPGAGKDTWLRAHGDPVAAISLDDIRAEEGISPTDNQGEVINEATERAKDLLRAKEPFIFNATNVVLSTRQRWESLFMRYGARVRIKLVDAPLSVLLHRNEHFHRGIPENVIKNLFWKFDTPNLLECHSLDRTEPVDIP